MATLFGDMIKHWRAVRRFSQLDLSLEAEMSARHLSFLESGRSNPSRGMVLRLSDALQLPRATTNQVLHAAGFIPAYPDLGSGAPELAAVERAIDMMLDAHNPFPGIALDRHWNMTAANKGAEMLLSFGSSSENSNLMDLLIAVADTGLIENWAEVAMLALTRLRTEILEVGQDDTLSAMAQRLAAHERMKSVDIADINLNQAIIPTIFRIGETRLSLFSTLSQFAAVQDIKAGETRVELMFPADDMTAEYFHALQKP